MTFKIVFPKHSKNAGGPAPLDSAQAQAEYDRLNELYEAQPVLVKRSLEAQAQKLVDAICQGGLEASFCLPEKVVLAQTWHHPAPLTDVRLEPSEQMLGGKINRLRRTDLCSLLSQRLDELEKTGPLPVLVSARLMRHAVAVYMVHRLLPAGSPVTYRASEGEDIPSLPVEETTPGGNTLVSRFYMPEWVVFDAGGALIAGSLAKAEAAIAAMQSFLAVLQRAVLLAPYMLADPLYQQKYYGISGQLVNQGRALANYQTAEIVRTTRHSAGANGRRISLRLPYFDDHALEMRTYQFELMLSNGQTAQAVRAEQAKVAQHASSPSTRKHLLSALRTLEFAFDK